MRDFFKPWRRKLGMVALVVACVFAAGWVRSASMLDGATIVFGPSRLVGVSGSQQFGFGCAMPQSTLLVNRNINGKILIEPWSFGSDPFQFRSMASGIKSVRTFEATTAKNILLVPYWCIVLPLTLLSAYLLLAKPRAATAMKRTEPSPTTGP